MGKGCITVTKYFLFLFNLIFFLLGALIMGFGLWVLLDNQSFLAVLQMESSTLKVGSYMLITIGALSMLICFLGCVGAIYEIRCLLALYFTCLLLIVIGQVTAAALIYFQRDLLKQEMAGIVNKLIINYSGENKTADEAWDLVQRKLQCCGWTGPGNWSENIKIKNSSEDLLPCSCRNDSAAGSRSPVPETGLCQSSSPQWPYSQGCINRVEEWFLNNVGVILGLSIGVAVIELLGMVLSMCLCRSVHQEDYTKVPRY